MNLYGSAGNDTSTAIFHCSVDRTKGLLRKSTSGIQAETSYDYPNKCNQARRKASFHNPPCPAGYAALLENSATLAMATRPTDLGDYALDKELLTFSAKRDKEKNLNIATRNLNAR
jgi:hypothetical protein